MLQVILTFSDSIFQHRNRVYILYTKIEQYDVYKIFYTRSIQIIYKKNVAATFCIQNLYKSLWKCGIQFVYILYTPILIYNKCTS